MELLDINPESVVEPLPFGGIRVDGVETFFRTRLGRDLRSVRSECAFAPDVVVLSTARMAAVEPVGSECNTEVMSHFGEPDGRQGA